VTIQVNDEETDLVMKLGAAGEAFFVHQTTEEELLENEDLRTSPIMSPTAEEGGMSPRERNYSSDDVPENAAIVLSNEEALAVVNDMQELEKKLNHEEQREILA
jgi:phosphatidate phosphatase PAH1